MSLLGDEILRPMISPIGKPGTLAPAGESGSKRVPSFIM